MNPHVMDGLRNHFIFTYQNILAIFQLDSAWKYHNHHHVAVAIIIIIIIM